MRGMNAAYHHRFFSDIRYTTLVSLALFTVGFSIDPRLFLAIPVIALMGACQTAFDAYYLIFTRHYATRLETFINAELGRDILVAHRMEDAYLFPLDRPKLVTLVVGSGFSWFGFMTALYSLVGVATYAIGLLLSVDVIGREVGIRAGGAYLIGLALITTAAAVVGVWWFPGGEGERRLQEALESAFAPSERSDPSA